jgi:hypothetical protein
MLVKNISEVLGLIDGNHAGGAVTGDVHAQDMLLLAMVLGFEARAWGGLEL